jgi:phosphotransferase system  glucose/maltose/N-acetylglucosamine-specific IIC component
MLLAVMAGGHIDGLAAALGIAALIALRRPDTRRALLAGVLAGAAAAVKAEFLLFGFGLGWAVWRSPRMLAALGAGAAAVLVPSYLLAGPGAVSAVVNRADASPVFFAPWQLLTRLVHLSADAGQIDLAGVVAFALLAAILLWRLPAGPSVLPAVRPALAVTLAWLMVSPQQRPWYDAMLFPLVALMPATRLDWIVIFRGVAGAIAELPGVLYYLSLRPGWLSRTGEILSLRVVPASLTLAVAGLLALCVTGRWRPAGRPRGQPAGPAGAAVVAAREPGRYCDRGLPDP